MSNVLEQSIEGISFIEKAEHSCNDLEESINQCVLMFSKSSQKNNNRKNITTTPFEISETPEKKKSSTTIHKPGSKQSSLKKTKPIKSILKTSKEKINEMKDKITKIFEDNTEIIDNITKINEKNQKDLNNAYALAQKEFENKMDKLYEDKIKRIRAINEEYDSEIFRLTKYCNDEKKDKKVYKDPSINEIILKQIKQDKEDELKKCESIFIVKKRDLFLDFKAMGDNCDDFTLDDRSVIYRNELFENLKDRINEVVQPEKRVSIKLALNVDNFKTDN